MWNILDLEVGDRLDEPIGTIVEILHIDILNQKIRYCMVDIETHIANYDSCGILNVAVFNGWKITKKRKKITRNLPTWF